MTGRAAERSFMETGTVKAGYRNTQYSGPSKTQVQKYESDMFFSEKLRFCSTVNTEQFVEFMKGQRRE